LFGRLIDIKGGLSASFNRILGDSSTDTAFGVSIFAYAGSPSSFQSQWDAQSHLAQSDGQIITDGILSTWEVASTTLTLPAGTNFVGIQLYARENVLDERSGLEFAGHYADDVKLTLVNTEVVPEPASWMAWLGLGAVMSWMLIRRKNWQFNRRVA